MACYCDNCYTVIMGTDIIDKKQNTKCSESRHLENSC